MNPSDALELAKGMGLTLPSPAWIFGCILFSLLGFAAWRYGKVVQPPRIRWLGARADALRLRRPGPTWLLYTARLSRCAARLWWNRPRARLSRFRPAG